MTAVFACNHIDEQSDQMAVDSCSMINAIVSESLVAVEGIFMIVELQVEGLSIMF